jgi:anhydro-N-acetylmuramic acid kinase
MNNDTTQRTEYEIGIGVMSGTSLDGLDLILCEFQESGYKILSFECIPFPSEISNKLREAHTYDALSYLKTENDFSRFASDRICEFHKRNGEKAKFIGIHGQTIFHQPEEGLTSQLLAGSIIAAATKLTTVCDFRRMDLALGGQGAPLVPIGDKDLFASYDACLNLGGFANISMDADGKRISFDICPVNFVLDRLARELGKDYDQGGAKAASGNIDHEVLNKLDALPFYEKRPPKSLGREWVEKNIISHLVNLRSEDALRTFTEHAGYEIANCFPPKGRVLVTGGGSYNSFLLSVIRNSAASQEIIVPEKELIDGKEALIFAYLAKLRLEGKTNVLASVTGASKDSCSGAVYLP